MIRADLRTYLLTKTDLTDLVGTRIYVLFVPQSDKGAVEYPCITFRRATGGHLHDLDGSAGFNQPLFEFDIWGRDSIEVENASEQLRLALQGFRGAMGTTTIARLTLDDEQDYYHPPQAGEKSGVFRIQQKYTVGFGVTKPVFD